MQEVLTAAAARLLHDEVPAVEVVGSYQRLAASLNSDGYHQLFPFQTDCGAAFQRAFRVNLLKKRRESGILAAKSTVALPGIPSFDHRRVKTE
jgi:hypothetical protein